MKKFSILAALIYALVGCALFGPFLDNPFLMDDEIQVVGNGVIQDISRWPTYFTSSTFDGGGTAKLSGIYYKPFMTGFYALVWHFFGADPAAYRAFLLALHIGSSFLVYLLFARFFPRPGAFFAGLIFLVHPINSEVVAYIADAQDTLYLFFGLLSLFALTSIRRRALAVPLFALSAIAALLSKETGALFLVLAPLYCFFFHKDRWKMSGAVSAAIVVVYAYVRHAVGLVSIKNPQLILNRATFLERLQTAPAELEHYVEAFFFPWRLSVVHDFIITDLTFTSFYLPLLVCLFTLVAIVGLVKTRTDRRLALWASTILLAWGALHGNILFPLDGTVADRWFYLASIASLLLIALALQNHLKSRKLWIAIASVITIVFAFRTYLRLGEWRDPIRLYQAEYQMHPTNSMMANNVGVELFRRGDIADSGPYFQKSVDINSEWDVPWNNLGAVAQRQGDTKRALELYAHAVSLGTYALAFENYAALLCQTGPIENCRTFVFQEALPRLPNNVKLRAIADTLNSLPSGGK